MLSKRELERHRVADYLEELTPQEIRLHMGELTALEMKLILSFIHWQAQRLNHAAVLRPRKADLAALTRADVL